MSFLRDDTLADVKFVDEQGEWMRGTVDSTGAVLVPNPNPIPKVGGGSGGGGGGGNAVDSTGARLVPWQKFALEDNIERPLLPSVHSAAGGRVHG